MLSIKQIEQFIVDGYVRIDQAFSKALAQQAREIIWRDLGCSEFDSTTWTRPVIRLPGYADPPFVSAANTPKLVSAYDQLVGPDRWVPMGGIGTFPIRFPTDQQDTGDTGWHIDVSFPGPDSKQLDYSTWRVNINSKNRALLVLFLFSDIGSHDAPTRIRVGSHLTIAKFLRSAGEEGTGLQGFDFSTTSSCEEAVATGEQGTVYLCHPFLVHAAQVNHGVRPRFLAQPPLAFKQELKVLSEATGTVYPVEAAIRRALNDQND